MAAADPKNRRRKYFIKKEFQTKFIIYFVVPIILTALISAFIVYRFSSQGTTTVFENSRLMIKPTSEYIVPGLILSGLLSAILVGIATMFVMFFQSHKIAGPLYKMESSIERMGCGDLSFNVRLRKGDAVQRLADVFNVTAKNLNSMITGVKNESEQLNTALARFKERLPKDQGVNIGNEIKKMEDAARHLNERINGFKLR
ncbi:MAG: methyl-accepting chemotaxis protein [Candidatus Omnitrophica bacterium]|nr:methyl-accepting chemotaxis protein [Candidatus Omnitrophota bacterium]